LVRGGRRGRLPVRQVLFIMIQKEQVMFPVSPEKEKALRERLESLGIYERDIKESFIRSGGKGGQNVNKTSTCVYLKHIPTGTEVKCQKTRSQGLNRYYARLLLYEKIEREIKGRESEEARRIAKIRRQKRKRSKRAKEKIFAEKRLQSIKKAERSFRYYPEEE
jgi:protein subunit release factor B